MGFEEMLSGDCASYMSATKDLLYELARLWLPDDTKLHHDTMVAKFLLSIKNTMSDRHIVNKNHNTQFTGMEGKFSSTRDREL